MITLSKQTVRRFIMGRQGLWPGRRWGGREGVAQAVSRWLTAEMLTSYLMSIIFWTLLGFLLGAIPFAPLIGRRVLGKDITQFGDKNPGATNVLRAGGLGWFSLALVLDISKGALPVGLAYQVYGWQGSEIIPIAVAPVLGHAFSPDLQGKGGKAIAAAFGVWIGLKRLCNLTENHTPLELMELPVAVPRDEEILLKVSACGVCHTELDEIEGRTPPRQLPIIPGHQVVGRVEAIGSQVSDINIGDRRLVSPGFS